MSLSPDIRPGSQGFAGDPTPPPTDAKEALNPHEVLGQIYGQSAIFVDAKDGEGRMIVTPDRVSRQNELVGLFIVEHFKDGEYSATGYFDAAEEHALGHFAPESGLPIILPAHKQIRLATNVLGSLAKAHADPDYTWYKPQFFALDRGVFKGVVKPGHNLRLEAKPREIRFDWVYGDVTIYADEKEVATLEGLVAGLIDDPQSCLPNDILVEAAAQSEALEILSNPNNKPLFTEIENVGFNRIRLEAGDVVVIRGHGQPTKEKNRFVGSATVENQDGKPIGDIGVMRALIAPTRVVQRMVDAR